ncbi:MAG: hypothetical protein H0U95_17775 [Bacteroidetes bacterium]|nr:hypothetical protein [Bacteroidota bacterium]
MKKLLIYFALIFISLNKFYAQVNFNWADQFAGGSSGAGSITQDASGNLYTVGSFSGAVDFDPGPGTFTLAGNGGYICKLDPNGNFIWAKNCANGNASGANTYHYIISKYRKYLSTSNSQPCVFER